MRLTTGAVRPEPAGELIQLSLDRGPCTLLLFLFFSFFYSARDLRGLSADRRETLPHDRKWVQFKKKTRSKIGGTPPKNLDAEKHVFSARFRTTSHFDREYLRKETIRHRQ